MPTSIIKSIVSRYYPEAQNDVLKILGLHLFIVLGLIAGLFLLVVDLAGLWANGCIQAEITIVLIFGVALYVLRFIRLQLAVQVFFLIPVVVYFFFISRLVAPIPNHLTISYTLWSFIFFFLFFLIFSNTKKNLTILYGLALLTITLHIYSAGLQKSLLEFRWQSESADLNPLVTLTFFYLAALLVSWNFQSAIDRLSDEKSSLERLTNQTIRNFPQGMLLLEIVKDEFGAPSHLLVKRTNLAFERLFRITSREIKDQKADDVFPKVFRNSIDWNGLFLQSKKSSFSFYLDRLDRYFEADILNLTENQIVSLFRDVTVRQKKIIELEESKLRYQVLLEAIPDLFFIIDKDGVYVDFVFKASENLKIKPDDIIGNSIFEVGFSEKMSAKIYQCIQNCIEYDTIETIEYALEVEGSSAMFEMRIVRLTDHTVISLARDISKRKLAEIQLEEAKNKAEEADRLKTAFLANISHEIRTPMNAIIGFSKMIGSPEFDDEEKGKFVEIIINNGKVLLTLINDMISLSKIESNTLVVKKGSCRVNDMIVTLYKEFSYDIDDHKNIRLKVNCENSNPKFSIVTDQVLLESIMQKLIDNGIKFTEEGEVEFGYRILANHLEFFVRDTGIGIAERDQERIFERFHQLDNRTIRAYEGTGLGLSIAQHYVRLLGGTMEVKSKLGKGSLFTFTIPYIKEREDSPLKIVR